MARARPLLTSWDALKMQTWIKEAALTMADPNTKEEQVELLKRNVEEWNVWRKRHPNVRPNLIAIIRTKSGADRTLMISLSTIRIGGRKFILSTHLDITDSKRTEEALRDSEVALHMAERASKAGSGDWNIATGEIRRDPELSVFSGNCHSDDLPPVTLTQVRSLR
jgi:hypothetical protein